MAITSLNGIPDPEEFLSSSKSRYLGVPFVNSGVFRTLGLYSRSKDVYDVAGKYYEIVPGVAFRPDLISQVVYGQPDYGWILFEANDIQDISGLRSGITLFVPDLTSVLSRISGYQDELFI